MDKTILTFPKDIGRVCIKIYLWSTNSYWCLRKMLRSTKPHDIFSWLHSEYWYSQMCQEQLKTLKVDCFILSCTKRLLLIQRIYGTGMTECKSALSFLQNLFMACGILATGDVLVLILSHCSQTPLTLSFKNCYGHRPAAIACSRVHKFPLFCWSACQQGRSRSWHHLTQEKWLL